MKRWIVVASSCLWMLAAFGESNPSGSGVTNLSDAHASSQKYVLWLEAGLVPDRNDRRYDTVRSGYGFRSKNIEGNSFGLSLEMFPHSAPFEGDGIRVGLHYISSKHDRAYPAGKLVLEDRILVGEAGWRSRNVLSTKEFPLRFGVGASYRMYRSLSVTSSVGRNQFDPPSDNILIGNWGLYGEATIAAVHVNPFAVELGCRLGLYYPVVMFLGGGYVF